MATRYSSADAYAAPPVFAATCLLVAYAASSWGCTITPRPAVQPDDAASADKPSTQKKPSAEQFKQRLAAAADDIDALRELRHDIWSALAPKTVQGATHVQQTDASTDRYLLKLALQPVLRRVHHRLAHLYLSSDQPVSALREVTAGMQGLPTVKRAPLANCEVEESECADVMRRLEAAYPNLCLEETTNSCAWLGDDIHNIHTPAGSPELQRRSVMDVHVLSATKSAAGWTVVSLDAKASIHRNCLGRFETDKIKEVRSDAIVIERTTWCREIKRQASPGLKATYLLTSSELEPRVGGRLRLLVDLKKRRLVKSGKLIEATYADAVVVSGQVDGKVFIANEHVGFAEVSGLY